jgi:hypothetical protein
VFAVSRTIDFLLTLSAFSFGKHPRFSLRSWLVATPDHHPNGFVFAASLTHHDEPD